MSWAHVLSLSRLIAAGPIAVLILEGRAGPLLGAAVLFALASVTDLLDGPLARHGRSVGPFGIYLDTTGDKILVSIVLVALATQHMVDAWMVMVIVGREFLISGVRTLSAVQGFVVPANLAGKLKTSVTLPVVTLVILAGSYRAGGWLGHADHVSLFTSIAWYGMLLATILTIWSGTRYVVDALPLFTSTPPTKHDMHPHSPETDEVMGEREVQPAQPG